MKIKFNLEVIMKTSKGKVKNFSPSDFLYGDIVSKSVRTIFLGKY